MNLMSKLAEFFSLFSKRLKEDKNFAFVFYILVGIIALLILVIVLVSVSKKDKKDPEQIVTDEVSENTAVDLPDYTIPTVALEENAYADVNALVNQYFAAMTTGDSATISALKSVAEQQELIKIEKESAYIDEFDNIKVYTKPGPLTNSYVAFVYYEIKFTNINTLAPGLTTLYICPKEDGSLYICDGDLQDEVTAYIKSIVAQEDVVDLFGMVETKYAEAIDADADLKAFMEGLSAKLDAEVSEAMAAIEAANNQPAEETPAEDTTEPAPVETVTEEQMVATDTVNVRNSDSENADRIGQIALGETVTRYEARENGWSRISYNGADGYVKSEFLQSADAVAQAGDTTAETPAPETPAPETPAPETPANDAPSSGSLTAKGSVTIKETVNVRKSSSETADKLGVAYQGEHYDLIMEQADGWCKISYNGQTGYVKTEYVE